MSTHSENHEHETQHEHKDEPYLSENSLNISHKFFNKMANMSLFDEICEVIPECCNWCHIDFDRDSEIISISVYDVEDIEQNLIQLEEYLENTDCLKKFKEYDSISKCVVGLKDDITLLQYLVNDDGDEEPIYLYV